MEFDVQKKKEVPCSKQSKIDGYVKWIKLGFWKWGLTVMALERRMYNFITSLQFLESLNSVYIDL